MRKEFYTVHIRPTNVIWIQLSACLLCTFTQTPKKKTQSRFSDIFESQFSLMDQYHVAVFVLIASTIYVLGFRCDSTRESPQRKLPRYSAQRRLQCKPLCKQWGWNYVSTLSLLKLLISVSPNNHPSSPHPCSSVSERGNCLCWRPRETRWVICALCTSWNTISALTAVWCLDLRDLIFVFFTQVFTYDPYDDSYQEVPINRYQTVYITPGAGPGMFAWW